MAGVAVWDECADPARQRYQRNARFYADEPQLLRVGGPTALGTREAFWRVLSRYWLGRAMTPTLLIQAEERVVDNRTHDRFVKFAPRQVAVKGKPLVIKERRTIGSLLKGRHALGRA